MNTADSQINITPMSAQEARECIAAIRANLESLRLMLLDLYRRRGWSALGYDNWEDCAVQEFGRSRSYVFRLLSAAQVEENLAASKSTIVDSSIKSTIVDLENIPITQLSELAKLPLDQQAEGLLKASLIAQAQGKKRNAMHVAQAVKSIKQKLEPPPAEDSNTQAPTQQKDAPTTVQQELEQQAENLGLPTSSKQVLPNVERNHLSPTDVDDRPFAFTPTVKTDVNVIIVPPSNISYLQDDQLKQIIKDAQRIIRDAKRELNQRRHPEYFQ